MFEDIKAAFNSALDAATRESGPSTSLMREAVIEARSAVKYMEEALERSRGKLARETRSLEDAVRRGGMAREIGDAETVRIAEEFAVKHREKVDVLTRKVEAQEEELQIARREEASMTTQLKATQRGGAGAVGTGTRAGGVDGDAGGSLGAEMDREMKESFAEQQLDELKRKMGK